DGRDRFEDREDLLRDDGVAEADKAVHSGGNPISHSTHVGFNCPEVPERIRSPGSESQFPAAGGRVAFFASFAVGVAYSPRTSISSGVNPGRWLSAKEYACGVGHTLLGTLRKLSNTAAWSDMP
ncbi:MAG: hypothetical protein WC489_08690, partial [Patescibacteria group bacterium]